ncbi:hypothetical protein GV791_07510 [Nocardia cyriacigeorgica]|uniref:Uncharacterized protein n=1 Tax=Nocardia cyriacigeorgica TaxID=135487 RepID=A0A6P1CMJ9_9NOCA|nr:hypothetical protein [Nocardia cyriacigeorgica]NEW32406.1 hypothetical protein [Nocardia cyriacigeorgica]
MNGEFRVLGVYPVSFMPVPFVVGTPNWDMRVGEAVRLHKKNGAIFDGAIESFDFHRPTEDQISVVFSATVAKNAEPGGVISPVRP